MKMSPLGAGQSFMTLDASSGAGPITRQARPAHSPRTWRDTRPKTKRPPACGWGVSAQHAQQLQQPRLSALEMIRKQAESRRAGCDQPRHVCKHPVGDQVAAVGPLNRPVRDPQYTFVNESK